MSKEDIFRQLISEICRDGSVNDAEMHIILQKGKELGLTQQTIKLMIDFELSEKGSQTEEISRESTQNISNSILESEEEEDRHVFRSAITRGGSILTPDIIVIEGDTITYRKRNKYLINVDSTSMKISNISSVELDTSIWGTDIIIKSFGAGTIVCKKFSLRDARKIKRLVIRKQKK